jgi:phage terminase large subunit-like protein
MSEGTPVDLSGLDDYRFWKPEYQRQALDLIKEYDGQGWKPFYCKNRDCDGMPHGKWQHNHARKDQRPPPWSDDWLVWLLNGGRGSGKTRTGSEVVNRAVNLTPRIALVAPTGGSLRQTLVEGISGILATAPPGQMPKWEPSKKQLTFPNGCIAQGFSGEEPDRLRGPEHGLAWLDEPAHYDDIDAVWANLLLGLRVGNDPKVICTTTPLPNRWMKEISKDPLTILTRVSTYANLANLPPVIRARILERYEGTRMGRQELHGEILEDVEGALWQWDMLRWLDEAPELERVVVGVDPAGTANPRSDETGIVVVGVAGDNLYVLDDFTGKYSPDAWAKKVALAVDMYQADAVVVEKTYGQDITLHVFESTKYTDARIIGADSRRGKVIRAEPIVALYERKRVFHVGQRGDLMDLEEEMTSWVPGPGSPSPNRVDALVHAATDLAKGHMPSSIATPANLPYRFPTKTTRHLRAI